jgi:hypothetical protein
MASSSWSHAFFTEKNFWAYPDLEADRTLLSHLKTWAYHKWKDVTLDDVEQAGQQEVLNWFCLIGTIAELRPVSESGGGENRTPRLTSSETNTSDTEAVQNHAKSRHTNTLSDLASPPRKHKPTLPAHQNDTSLHQKCATCVPQSQPPLPDDLAKVVDAWASLPNAVQARILTMVKAARQQ